MAVVQSVGTWHGSLDCDNAQKPIVGPMVRSHLLVVQSLSVRQSPGGLAAVALEHVPPEHAFVMQSDGSLHVPPAPVGVHTGGFCVVSQWPE